MSDEGANAALPLGTIPKEGDVIADKYEVRSILGRGGMGVVVEARHRHLGELVAIKFLYPAASRRPEAVARFLREARGAARIKSENVVRTIDVDKLPSGTPY